MIPTAAFPIKWILSMPVTMEDGETVSNEYTVLLPFSPIIGMVLRLPEDVWPDPVVIEDIYFSFGEPREPHTAPYFFCQCHFEDGNIPTISEWDESFRQDAGAIVAQ